MRISTLLRAAPVAGLLASLALSGATPVASANHRLLDCRDVERSAAPDRPCIRYCPIYDTTGEFACGIERLPTVPPRVED